MNDRARAEEGYDYYVDHDAGHALCQRCRCKSGVALFGRGQPKAANANPEDFYDMSFLKKIEDSGFTKQLVSRR